MFNCDRLNKSSARAAASASQYLTPLAAVAAAVSMALILPSAHAGGRGFAAPVGATEWTQLANNAQLLKVSADSALTAKKMVEKYMTQLQQLQIQMQNIARLGQAPEGLQDIILAQQSLTNYRTSLERLYGSLEQQRELMDRRFTEARLSGMTWDQYRERQTELARQQNQRAIQRLNHESQVLRQVQHDFEYSQRMAEKAPMSEGIHQSTQMLNHQMSRLVAQNAQITQVLLTTQQDETRQMSEEAAAKHRFTEELHRLNQRDAAIRERQRRFVEGSR